MSTLGETLRNARLKKNVSISDAAVATRVTAMVLESLENDDLSLIPAPIYGKGYLRMYADYLQIDPAPLIEEYLNLVSAKSPAQLKPLVQSAAQVEKQRSNEEKAGRKPFLAGMLGRLPKVDWNKYNLFRRLFAGGVGRRIAILIMDDPWKCLLIAAGVLILLIFLLSGARQWFGPSAPPAREREGGGFLKVPYDPPDSYLEMKP